MTVIDCGKLRLTFDPSWQAIAWDDHPEYREKVLGALQRTAAVDVVARTGSHMTLYVEAKDFRGHALEHIDDFKEGETSGWVARKVRDTLAGVLGTYTRTKTKGELWRDLALAPAETSNCVVLFWAEVSPGWLAKPLNKALLNEVRDQLERQVKWLTQKVIIVNSAEHEGTPVAGVQLSAR